MMAADDAEIWVFCVHLKNFKLHEFFPKLLSFSVNKTKASFQTTGKMQITTKLNSDVSCCSTMGKTSKMTQLF